MKLGNWLYEGIYRTQYHSYTPNQNNSNIVLDVPQSDESMYWRSGVDIVCEAQWIQPDLNNTTKTIGGTTNFVYLQSRFDWASDNKDLPWKYGSLLFTEETWTPGQRAEWNPMRLNIEIKSKWDINGSITLAGVELLHIKPWYELNYGTWDQSWYDNATQRDSIVKLWSEYFSAQTAKAWNIHMHDLGKLSCVIGPTIIPNTPTTSAMNFVGKVGGEFYIPKLLWDEYMKFDMLIAYQYPSCIDCSYTNNKSIPINASLDVVKQIRETYNYTGILCWLGTKTWLNDPGVGTTDNTVFEEEFKIVYPYIDYYLTSAYIDPATKLIDGVDRAIKFNSEYCIPSCDFTIE